jgi:hypothetical protein
MDPDSISQFVERFMELEDPDQKGYIEPIVRPERFDVNKDRKISRLEVKKAIFYVIYPKDEKKKIEISNEFKSHIKNNVELYVKNLKNDFINYKQFAYLMNTIAANDFLNEEMIRDIQQAKISKTEASQEL